MTKRLDYVQAAQKRWGAKWNAHTEKGVDIISPIDTRLYFHLRNLRKRMAYTQ